MQPSEFTSKRAGKVTKDARGEWAFVPAPLPPALTYTPAIIARLAEAERAVGALAGMSRMLPNPALFIPSAIHREAVFSSRLAGAVTALRDLFFFEADANAPAPPDAHDVRNYALALEYGLVRLEEEPVSLRLVRELHARLMVDAGGTLHDAAFVPVPPERLPEALDAWEGYLSAESEIPALIRLAMIHYQFAVLHPFENGNGRIGRLLLSLLLRAWDIVPYPLLHLSAFFARHHDDYARLLPAVSQQGAWEEWVAFFLTAVRDQAREALATGMQLHALREAYQARAVNLRPRITPLIIDRFFLNPVNSLIYLRDELGIDYTVIKRSIDTLTREGIVHEATGKQRSRLWLAPEILRILTGEEK